MESPPFDLSPSAAIREMTAMNQKMMRGTEMLQDIDAEDIEIGPTPKTEVYSEDKLRLYHYEPRVESPHAVPVLIVYALVNRPYMVDLQENLSLVQNLLDRGLDLYLIDWGYPSRVDRYLTLNDYINGYIDRCVDTICERHDLDAINVLGICQGGVFSMCYSSLHAEKVQNLITMVAPVDFHVEADDHTGLLNAWAREMDADLMVETFGNVPGDLMNFGYLMLKPFSLSLQKYVNMVDLLDDESKLVNFLRMEKWIFDSPDQAGEAWRQFIQDFYQDNKLIDGTVAIGERRVDLQNLTMPVLNVYADYDHLVPPASSQALAEHVGTDDYTSESFPVGHIGMYVSSKVQGTLPPLIADWVTARG
jgi:polyhydroxyalkanoate synthase